ncbi:hypothetical protein DY000_02017935 [Brassica cretica]|uniref:SPX domain-containing protein n=1 Tax=Brassica cretica TaxID=69181 RepID=A0ABQ7D6Q8_BRACR|nr:hypothetical protein DY000_02017935 [Brassica cretica]
MMKKKVKQYGEQIRGCSQHPRHVLKDFSRMLDTQLRESYRDVGRDLLLLLVLVELNAISLRKILKKFDKRFGYRFADYYVKTRSNHPYSQSPYNAWSSNRKAACYLSPCL